MKILEDILAEGLFTFMALFVYSLIFITKNITEGIVYVIFFVILIYIFLQYDSIASKSDT